MQKLKWKGMIRTCVAEAQCACGSQVGFWIESAPSCEFRWVPTAEPMGWSRGSRSMVAQSTAAQRPSPKVGTARALRRSRSSVPVMALA